MTVTAPEVRRDAKAGYCSMCRAESHKLCTSDECICTMVIHRARPGFGRAGLSVAPVDDGLCGYCRARAHKRCTSPSCACDAGLHPGRGTAATALAEDSRADERDDPIADVRARARASQAGAAPPKETESKLREPVWRLVKVDPPAPPPKPKKLTAVERARPFVEDIMAAGSRDWHRFAIFPSSMGAAQVRTRVAKAFREFEFKSVRVPDIGQSALYGRWNGKRPAGQL